MKKLYTLILFAPFFASAQLTLTQPINEPVIGNIDYGKDFDSTVTLPRNTGANQVWNFTTLTSNTNNVVSNTYTTPSSLPNSSSYTTATIGMTDGNTNTFFKSSSNKYEMVGLNTSTMTLNFTNTAIIANWPVAFGYNNNDPVAGNVTSSYGNGTFTGNIISNASGTGTVQLPNSISFTNCLQVTTTLNINATITVSLFPVSVDLQLITYQYYHSSQKFPIVTVTTTGFNSPLGTNTTTAVSLNNNIFAGINELTLDNSYSVYPNPATGIFTLELSNPEAETISIEILNQAGQVIKKEELGNTAIKTSVNIQGINSGVYFVKTNAGNRSSVKKLIIQ